MTIKKKKRENTKKCCKWWELTKLNLMSSTRKRKNNVKRLQCRPEIYMKRERKTRTKYKTNRRGKGWSSWNNRTIPNISTSWRRLKIVRSTNCSARQTNFWELGAKVLIQKGNEQDEREDDFLNPNEAEDDIANAFENANSVYYNLTHTVKE